MNYASEKKVSVLKRLWVYWLVWGRVGFNPNCGILLFLLVF